MNVVFFLKSRCCPESRGRPQPPFPSRRAPPARPPPDPLPPHPPPQNQLRAQAQEIGKLQGTVDALNAENRDLLRRLDAPPANQLLASFARGFQGQEAIRLESVEEKVHCNSYKSHTDARFRLFGAPGRFRGAFPDIHNAKVEIATPEAFGEAVKAQVEFKPLQPVHAPVARVAVDVGELLGFRGAPTLVVSPDPPFLINERTRWNPQLEARGVTDGGTDWEARYSVSNDGAVLRAIEGEVRHSHPIYGDFAISRWLQEDDIERYKRFGGDRFGTPTSARWSRSSDGFDTDDGSEGPGTPRRTSPRRALWGNLFSPGGGRGRRGRGGSGSRSGSRSGSPRSPASRGSSRRSRGSSRSSWLRDFAPPTPRWLASWRRDCDGYEVTAKIGDAMAVANEAMHKSGGSMSTGGGIINSDGIWVTSDTWEAEVSARRQLQHNLDGRVAARFVAREVEVGMSYHFTEEFKGWHVDAKAILSPNGIATPEFTLHHVWDF